MRRYASIAVLICLIIGMGCLLALRREKVSEYNRQRLVYNNRVVSSYENKNRYTVLLSDGLYVKSKIIFSNDRNPIYSLKTDLIENQDFSKLIGMTYEEAEEILGKFHCDCGSGLFYPSYITRDGYLIMLSFFDANGNYNRDEVIGSVTVIDLLTAEDHERRGTVREDRGRFETTEKVINSGNNTADMV